MISKEHGKAEESVNFLSGSPDNNQKILRAVITKPIAPPLLTCPWLG
jgi:hypothetical protein